MLNGLDLFSGIGGISIALSEWIRPIAYCEIDPYCQGVLLSRMVCGLLQEAPIWTDIKTLQIYSPDNSIDILYGGFPCQDISVGGHGKGLAGERSGLFHEIMRLSKEIKPKFIFLENVPAILTRGGEEVIRTIAEMGYDCRWCVVSASKYVDQRRERWFLLAKSGRMRLQERPCEGIQQIRQTSFNEESCNYKLQDMESWGAYARSMRKDHGIPNRVDRVRALGNAVVPNQAKEAFKILMGIKSQP
jgi:DNA (cytosine-5)-methyltransferase 1